MIRSLTSFRFVFALMVFLSHTSFVTQEGSWFLDYKVWLKQGFIGVNFFFILSGFILSYNYYDKFSTLHYPSIVRFYWKRFLKIYPSTWVMLLLSFYFAQELWTNRNYISILLSNFLLVQAWVPNNGYQWFLNPPAWSLSVEIFFYFLFPFLIASLHKVKWTTGIIIVLGFILVQGVAIWFLDDPSIAKFWFYLFPLSNLALFLCGIGLYIMYKGIPLHHSIMRGTALEIVAIFVVIGCVAWHQQVPENFRFVIYYLPSAAALIFVFSFEQGMISKFLGNRVFVYLGNISFQFYLLHFLAIWFWCKVDYLYIQGLSQNLIVLLSFSSTLIGAVIMYHAIELPAQKMKR